MQERYAAEDAIHLAEIYRIIDERLDATKRAWVLEDGAELVANLRREVDPDDLYRDAKLGWKLSRQQLAVLRELYAWRDIEARRRDQPRNRIIREHALWPLAKFQPDNLVALARIEDMHPRTVRQDGNTLLKMIREAAELPRRVAGAAARAAAVRSHRAVEEAARDRPGRSRAPGHGTRAHAAQEAPGGPAQDGLPRRPLQPARGLQGWRRELMGQALLDALAGDNAP